MCRRIYAAVLFAAVLLGVAACGTTKSVRIERNFTASPAPESALPDDPATALTVAKGGVTVRIGYGEYNLETLTVTPPGPGPVPLAVISHGVPLGGETARRKIRLRRYLPLAKDFAHRGYKVVVFARRGFASSSGPYQEGWGCGDPSGLSWALSARNGGKDYAAVIAEFAKRPEVDGSRVVVAGQSGGGFAASALASNPPPGLIGIVSFAGGRGGMRKDGRRIRGNCNEEGFVRAFGRFGDGATVPALWLYSTTDKLFWPELVDRAFDAYAANGAPVRLERVGALRFTDNGHLLYRREGRGTWRPLIDAFLDAIGAPNRKPPSKG